MRPNKKFIYPLLIILSAVLFGILPSLVRYTRDYGGNEYNLPFLSNFAVLPVMFLNARRRKVSLHVGRKIIGKIAIKSLGAATTPMILMVAYAYIPTGMASTLHFVYPVLVALALSLFFGEKLGGIRIAALAVTVGGIAAMSLDGIAVNWIGIALALLSGITWAFQIIFMDKTELKDLDPSVLSFYGALFSMLFPGLLGLLRGQLTPFTSPLAMAIAVLVGLLGGAIAGPCFQVGLRGTGSLAASILSTFEPITSVVVGILFLGEASTVGKIVGCLLVVSGVCLIVYANHKDSLARQTVGEHT